MEVVSIRVKKEVLKLADRMIRLGLAKNRSQAINMMIERGMDYVKREVERWEEIRKNVEKMRKSGFRIRRGDLSKILEEDREGR